MSVNKDIFTNLEDYFKQLPLKKMMIYSTAQTTIEKQDDHIILRNNVSKKVFSGDLAKALARVFENNYLTDSTEEIKQALYQLCQLNLTFIAIKEDK